MEPKDLAPRGLAGANQLSTRLSQGDMGQMQQLIRQMMAAYPHQEISPDTADVYLMAYEDVTAEFGLEPLRAEMRLALSRSKFFPHPAEIREALAGKRKTAAMQELAATAIRRSEEASLARDAQLRSGGEEGYVTMAEIYAEYAARKLAKAEAANAQSA